jgi:hypothetical protein
MIGLIFMVGIFFGIVKFVVEDGFIKDIDTSKLKTLEYIEGDTTFYRIKYKKILLFHTVAVNNHNSIKYVTEREYSSFADIDKIYKDIINGLYRIRRNGEIVEKTQVNEVEGLNIDNRTKGD